MVEASKRAGGELFRKFRTNIVEDEEDDKEDNENEAHSMAEPLWFRYYGNLPLQTKCVPHRTCDRFTLPLYNLRIFLLFLFNSRLPRIRLASMRLAQLRKRNVVVVVVVVGLEETEQDLLLDEKTRRCKLSRDVFCLSPSPFHHPLAFATTITSISMVKINRSVVLTHTKNESVESNGDVVEHAIDRCD